MALQRQKTLLEAGALQSAIFNSANFSSIATDAKGVIQIFNVGAERMLGYAAAEVMNKITPAELSDPQEVIARAKALSLELETPITPGFEALVFKASRGIEDIYELTYIRKDGSHFPAIVSVTALRDAHGNIIGYLLIGTDNTARKRVELALQAGERRYRHLFDSSRDALVVLMPPSWLFSDANQAALQMFGAASKAVISALRPWDVSPKRQPDGHPSAEGALEMIATAMREGSHFFEWTHQRLNGETFAADVLLTRMEAGGQVSVQGTVRDISERKQAEAELARQAQEVRAANQELQAANAELDSFSYSVSHDLRAPLRHVLGYVELLTREIGASVLSAKARHHLQTITDAGVEMGQLIDDLLAFSRMGKVELHENLIGLDGLVQDSILALDSVTQGRSIDWKIAPLPEVFGDPSVLKQVLVNLIGNAVKYSRPRNPARIEISCAGEEDGRAILFVRDNGVGFDMQYADKLFGVFQRLHGANEFEGTGIGLAMVRRVIARHGGRVWAEGALNQGATFYFTLRLATAG